LPSLRAIVRHAAASIDFSETSSFTAAFRKATGLSPPRIAEASPEFTKANRNVERPGNRSLACADRRKIARIAAIRAE
jgi:AraC-like DNA-binding protein